MCGRYYIDDSMTEKIRKVIRDIDNRLRRIPVSGDIYPTNPAPVITSASHYLQLQESRWGYPGFENRNVIINARSETVGDKRYFRNGIERGRIVIPAVHFYEWNSQRTKYTFRREDGQLLFLAGIADFFEDESRFVILTTQANPSMVPVHSRMPLILEQTQVKDWIQDEHAARHLLKQTPVMLEKQAEYEQMTVFDFL